MPALKMKTKSSMICSREGNGLGVCSKSSIISKNSCSQVRISQQAVSLESSIQSDQDLSSKVEVSARENECDAVDHQEFFDGEPCQFQKPPLSAADSSSVGRMEFLPATWPSNLETIFSPIFESIEVHCKPDIYNYAVGNVAHLKANDNNDGSSISCDYQTCNVSDFYISDMTVVDEIMEANLFSDYECIHHDMTEKNMTLPFLEETVETRNTLDAKSCEEAIMNSDDACLHLVIQQIKSCDQESELSSLFFDPDEADYFDPHLFIKNLPGPSDVVPSFRPILLPKEAQKRKSITLVLDLDETLVHSSLDHAVDADFTFPVFFNMKEHIVYVRQRPYLHAFLERVAEMFEIIIFTASQSIYAEQLLNILDPERKLISQRAYRESCIFSDGSYIKDLTVLGVDLAKVAIIDNTPQVYQLQVNNGIPIKSWFDDPSDRALISLLPFLETLVDVDDVRPIIAKRYSKE